MRTLKAVHLGSGREAAHWPAPTLPEYAFIGRSNVGKSSLVNMLAGIHKLARVSTTPGKTRNVEHFRVEGTLSTSRPWMLADLPGYGFARTGRDERAAWKRMIDRYLLERDNLQCVFLLVDVRLEPQRSDLEMVQWLGEHAVPFAIVFTKCDKLAQPKVQGSVALWRRTLKRTWQELPTMFITSAEARQGREALLEFIDGINAQWGLRPAHEH